MPDLVSVSRSVSLVGRDVTVARERFKREQEEQAAFHARLAREAAEWAEVVSLARDALRRAFGKNVHFAIFDGEISWEGESPTAEQVDAALEAAGLVAPDEEDQ